MKFLRSDIVELCEALGFKTAAKWPKPKMMTKLKEIVDTAKDGGVELESEKLQGILGRLVVAKEFEVVASQEELGEAAAEAPEKEVEEVVEEAAEAEETEAPKKKGKKIEKAGDGKGPGVIGSIVEFLTAASEEKPISKDQILKKLEGRFPDRPAESMKRTINVQIPARIQKEKKVVVKKNDKGYWIAGKAKVAAKAEEE